MTRKIAMWSGPRNISTAMMRSWENRPDCKVIDEPFYAYYLAQTKLKHPMYEDVLQSQPLQWQTVVEQLKQDDEHDLFYQKHMTHHMLPDIDLSWCKEVSHCFLIRDPASVLNSYVKKIADVSSDDIGIERQFELYQQLCTLTGQEIPIINSVDVLRDPKGILSRLCQRLDIPFDAHMLHWPQGPRDSDGVWAKHWYQNVESSTQFCQAGFEAFNLPEHLIELAEYNNTFYRELQKQRITTPLTL